MHLHGHSSGLVVANAASDERAIQRELTQLDDRLFLISEGDSRYGRLVYRVLCEVAGDVEPIAVCDWRDAYGQPLPLSTGLLDLVRSLRPRDGTDLLEATRRHNEELRQRTISDFERDIDEIAADMGPWLSGKRSAGFHRSAGLSAARRRQRQAGRKV